MHKGTTPHTLRAWFRILAGSKYDSANRRSTGRPSTKEEIAELAVPMAKEKRLGATHASAMQSTTSGTRLVEIRPPTFSKTMESSQHRNVENEPRGPHSSNSIGTSSPRLTSSQSNHLLLSESSVTRSFSSLTWLPEKFTSQVYPRKEKALGWNRSPAISQMHVMGS